MPNLNGVTYYKLRSGFQGDITKNCSLTASEVDHNFLFLRGYDVVDFAWDTDAKELVLTRLNGEKLIIQGILNSIDASASYYNSSTGTLVLNIEGNEFPVTGFPLDEDIEEIKRKLITLSGNVEAISGNVSDISLQISDMKEDIQDNATDIVDINDFLRRVEKYPGKSALPSVSLSGVAEEIIAEIGSYYTVDPSDVSILYKEGAFDSKGSNLITPEYSKAAENVRITINYPGSLTYNPYSSIIIPVPKEGFIVYYSTVATFSAPTNLPETNYDRPTPLTSVTDSTSAATWSGFSQRAELVSKVIGKYPCYTNSDGVTSLVDNLPSFKQKVRKEEKYIVDYPPNSFFNDIHYQFYFPETLELKAVKIFSGAFGFMNIMPTSYTVEDYGLIGGVNYSVIDFKTNKNIEAMKMLIILEEK